MPAAPSRTIEPRWNRWKQPFWMSVQLMPVTG